MTTQDLRAIADTAVSQGLAHFVLYVPTPIQRKRVRIAPGLVGELMGSRRAWKGEPHTEGWQWLLSVSVADARRFVARHPDYEIPAEVARARVMLP